MNSNIHFIVISLFQISTNSTIKYLTQPHNEISVNLMFHVDKALTRKLSKDYKTRSRGKLKAIVQNVLNDARKLFDVKKFNRSIKFNLLDTKFLRNNQMFAMDENASTYLKNYCDFQSKRKVAMKRLYLSVLLTGLDIFHVNNGKTVRANSGKLQISLLIFLKQEHVYFSPHF